MAKKSSPWSVKGIGQDTRDIVKRAAGEGGLTIGAWIDQAIIEDAKVAEASAADFDQKTVSDPGDDAIANLPALAPQNASSMDEALDILDDELASAEARLDETLRPVLIALHGLASRVVEAEKAVDRHKQVPEPDETASDDPDLDEFWQELDPVSEEPEEVIQEPQTPEHLRSEPVAPTWDLDETINPDDLKDPNPDIASPDVAPIEIPSVESAPEDDPVDEESGEMPPWAAYMAQKTGSEAEPDYDQDEEPLDDPDPFPRPTDETDDFEAFLEAKRQEVNQDQPVLSERFVRSPRRRWARVAALFVVLAFFAGCGALYVYADKLGYGAQKQAFKERVPHLIEDATKTAKGGYQFVKAYTVELYQQNFGGGASETDAMDKRADEPVAKDQAVSSAMSSAPLKPDETMALTKDASDDRSDQPMQSSEMQDKKDAPEPKPMASEPSSPVDQKPSGKKAEKPAILSSDETAKLIAKAKSSQPAPAPVASPEKPEPVMADPVTPKAPTLSSSETNQQVASVPKNGLGETIDDDWIKSATKRARQGDARAQHDLAVLYATGKGVGRDMKEAASWFREAAIQGVSNAQYNLGVLYEQGDGVVKDEVRALLWYHSAAEQGHPLAQYNLGIFHAEGRGIPLSFGEAARWFQRAADQGVAKAMYNLGIMTEEGLGVPPNTALAESWFNQAADLGNEDAILRLSELSGGSLAPGKLAGSETTRTEQAMGGAAIAAIQEILAQMDLYKGAIDGIAGPGTKSAIRTYQRQHKLAPTGVPTEALLAHLMAQERS